MKGIYQKLKDKIRRLSVSLVIPLLIILFLAAYMSQRIVIIIPAGHAGVFWSLFFGGTKVNYVYPEGIHFILPYNKMYIYNVRIQEISPELDVLSKTGLKVHLFLSIRYAPEYRLVGVLHKKVGPDYALKVIIPEIESVLREIIGTMDAEDIYTTGRELIVKAIGEAIEQVAQRYINVDDVIIRQIELPPMVQEAIKFKIKQKHLVEAHEYIVQKEKKEAERKRIEAQGIHDHNIIVTKSLSDEKILKWKGIQAIHAFAESNNAKVFVIGVGENGVPIILNPGKTE